MPLVQHSDLPTFARLREHGHEVLSLERFGASAPGQVVIEHLGFSADRVVERAKALLERLEQRTVT